MTNTQTATGTKFLGKCAWAGHRFTATAAHRAYCPSTCPTCAPVVSDQNGTEWVQRSAIKWAPIKATESGSQCGAHCIDAIGPVCMCQCGGENHGSGHGHL